MKKSLCLFLCVLFILSALFVSCGKEEGENSGTSSETQSTSQPSGTDSSEETTADESSADSKYTDESGKYVNKNLPEFKNEWRNYNEFRVLVYDNTAQTTYFSEEIESLYDTTDSKIVEGVNTRNKWIEDNYGIKIKAVPVADVSAAFRAYIQGGVSNFDVAMPFMASCAVFAQEGSLYDLREFSDYIDLEAPWWDQNATDSLSVNNRVYFTTGDISFMQKIVSGGVAFNKKLMTSYFPDVDMYSLVSEGKWTLDTFYSMCKEATHQGDDDEKMDENDNWGCMGGGIGLYYGAGETLCSKNAEDIPQISIGKSDRSVAVAQKVLTYLAEKGTWYVTVNEFTDQTDKWGRTVRIFGSDQALFMTFAFSAIKKLRVYDVEFGVIPVPKYDENQDNYYSSCTANMAYGICIPLNAEDPEYCAYMIELLAVGGKNNISNAYYTSVLKGKDMDTEDDEKMLDIIFGGIVYDTALVYGFSGLNNLFNTAKADTLISTLESINDSVEEAIAKVVDAYQD